MIKCNCLCRQAFCTYISIGYQRHLITAIKSHYPWTYYFFQTPWLPDKSQQLVPCLLWVNHLNLLPVTVLNIGSPFCGRSYLCSTYLVWGPRHQLEFSDSTYHLLCRTTPSSKYHRLVSTKADQTLRWSVMYTGSLLGTNECERERWRGDGLVGGRSQTPMNSQRRFDQPLVEVRSICHEAELSLSSGGRWDFLRLPWSFVWFGSSQEERARA